MVFALNRAEGRDDRGAIYARMMCWESDAWLC